MPSRAPRIRRASGGTAISRSSASNGEGGDEEAGFAEFSGAQLTARDAYAALRSGERIRARELAQQLLSRPQYLETLERRLDTGELARPSSAFMGR